MVCDYDTSSSMYYSPYKDYYAYMHKTLSCYYILSLVTLYNLYQNHL